MLKLPLLYNYSTYGHDDIMLVMIVVSKGCLLLQYSLYEIAFHVKYQLAKRLFSYISLVGQFYMFIYSIVVD